MLRLCKIQACKRCDRFKVPAWADGLPAGFLPTDDVLRSFARAKRGEIKAFLAVLRGAGTYLAAFARTAERTVRLAREEMNRKAIAVATLARLRALRDLMDRREAAAIHREEECVVDLRRGEGGAVDRAGLDYHGEWSAGYEGRSARPTGWVTA